MRICVLRETAEHERRVALLPDSVKRLVGKKLEVVVQSGAGVGACVSDADYQAAGATIAADAKAALEGAQVALKVQPVSAAELAVLPRGITLVSLMYPLSRRKEVEAVAQAGLSLISLDAVPRTTLAQMMDVLSSQASLAGYRAVLLAAEALPKLFPMMMTAAGTLAAARVLVLGAGVAGLQAIATARRLGATVEAYDVRKVVKEQVESLGARFVDVPTAEDAQTAGGYAKEVSEETRQKQAQVLREHIAKADAVITTALVPGKKAPVLVTEEMVKAMRAGSVIVDLAAEQGGNCAVTRPGERVVVNGVTVIGEVNVPSHVAVHASLSWSRNVEKLLVHLMGKEATALKLEASDEITQAMVTVRDGVVVDPRLKQGAS
ncbi:MAG: NAD(P) transhydrogenase subunit alpha [Archangiaceae bacterium]|nr:NAD(P) transhydrogenase subunit alpha [Archangiaceae bacterium]